MKELFSKQFWTDSINCHLEYRNPQSPFPMHSHDFFEIAVVYSGKGTHNDFEEQFELSEGDLLCVHPGQSHSYSNVENLELMNILIRPDFFYDLNDEIKNCSAYTEMFSFSIRQRTDRVRHIHLTKMQLLSIKELISQMQKEFNEGTILYSVQIQSILVQLILYILRVKTNPDYPVTQKRNNANEVILYMEKNFTETITMQDLMEIGGMSESSVLRAFKNLTGYAPFVYQNRLRMLAAIERLSQSNKDITIIAYECGFNDSNYFSRSFKKFVNMTPTEYREKFGKK